MSESSCSSVSTCIPQYSFCLLLEDAKDKSFVWKDVDGVEVDLTGKSISLLCEETSLNKTASIVDPTSGEFSFSFDSGDTQSILNGLNRRYFNYTVKETTQPRTLWSGFIIVES